jgi:hypothetical protein
MRNLRDVEAPDEARDERYPRKGVRGKMRLA